MSTTRPVPTTSYSFVFTTYMNPSPSVRSSYPTTYTETTWLPSVSADTDCALATAFPRLEGPDGLKAGCVISNAAEVNPHAFWDVYDCCPGRDMSAYGYLLRNGSQPGYRGICMVQCSVDDGDMVTWQQVGECLQKSVKEVVCSPNYAEQAKNETEQSLWSEFARTRSLSGTISPQASATQTNTGPGAAEGTGQSVSAGAAASLDVVHTTTSKACLFTFLILAAGSAAGMLV